MKRLLLSFIAVLLVCPSSNIFAQNNTDQERNKKIAVKYHELNPDDIDAILTEDFIGRTNEDTWDREVQRQFWKDQKAEDKILHLVAEDDMVAIRFIRTGEFEGEKIRAHAMQFMRFENGKIAEIWEIFGQSQVESMDE